MTSQNNGRWQYQRSVHKYDSNPVDILQMPANSPTNFPLDSFVLGLFDFGASTKPR